MLRRFVIFLLRYVTEEDLTDAIEELNAEMRKTEWKFVLMLVVKRSICSDYLPLLFSLDYSN